MLARVLIAGLAALFGVRPSAFSAQDCQREVAEFRHLAEHLDVVVKCVTPRADRPDWAGWTTSDGQRVTGVYAVWTPETDHGYVADVVAHELGHAWTDGYLRPTGRLETAVWATGWSEFDDEAYADLVAMWLGHLNDYGEGWWRHVQPAPTNDDLVRLERAGLLPPRSWLWSVKVVGHF